MAVALDPGWYADPYGDTIERYHDGADWTSRVRRPGMAESLVEQDVHAPSNAPRRIAAVCAALIAFLAYNVVILGGLFWGLPFLLSWAVLIVGWVTFTLIAAPHASCPRWIAVAPVIPIFGAFLMLYFAYLVTWRTVYLPYRDWPIGGDEMDHWRQVRNPKRPGELLYVRR